ncbi:PaaI family thioesterase [Minwuia sp.]|uniref:PaaI family thioesterase n=1 Tax=Minwuia sp. TaxID=2493630 RepID=UPI003A8FF404
MTGHDTGWTIERIRAHVAENLPITTGFGFEVVSATPECCDVLIHDNPTIFRPGGVVAGPVLFAAADVGAYGIILAATGDPASTTVDLIIHFLRPGAGLPLLARTTPIKFGRRLVTTETIISPQDNPDRQIARATSTYIRS